MRVALPVTVSLAIEWTREWDLVEQSSKVKLMPKMVARSADTVISSEFLTTRAKLLEVAATLDRIDRAESSSEPMGDLSRSQLKQLRDAIMILTQSGSTDRTATMQQLFSKSYDPDWKTEFGIAAPTHLA